MAKVKSTGMQTNYKGFELQVARDKSLAGESLVFYSIFRKTDKWLLADGNYEGMSMRDVMADIKLIVDDFIQDPEPYLE